MIANAATAATIFAPSAILGAGMIDDLRSKKFHNWLFLSCCAFALLVTLIASGLDGLLPAVLGFFAGIILVLPLVKTKMVGAGDMKLFAAFGIAAGWSAVVSVLVLSLIWGAIFGVIRAFADKKGAVLLHNLFSIVTLKKREELELNKMPFAVAIFMGWLSYLVLEKYT